MDCPTIKTCLRCSGTKKINEVGDSHSCVDACSAETVELEGKCIKSCPLLTKASSGKCVTISSDYALL